MPTMQRKAPDKTRADKAKNLHFGHLRRLTTEIGMWQHTAGDTPNPRHGYSIDDEARGLIVGLRYWQENVEPEFSRELATTCFEFIRAAAIKNGTCKGRYHNFCDADKKWLDSIGSEDSFGRTLWGLGVAYNVNAPFAPQEKIEPLLRHSLPLAHQLNPLRAKAFVLLGLAAARVDDILLHQLADELCEAYDQTASDDWQWFEEGMTYCNARLPQALLTAAALFPDQLRWARVGTSSLEFLLKISKTGKAGYAPIGNRHMTTRAWFQRGEARPPMFDQQPVDAGALVEACVEAFLLTGRSCFQQAANEAFDWYFGLNIHNIPVYNPETGGVGDAVTPVGVNKNQGAESVLSIHLAYQALQRIGSQG